MRVQISASETFAKKNFTLFRSFREYFRHAEKLLPSPSETTH